MATKRIFTPEEAQKKYDALPAEIKSLLYTPEVTSVIQKVGEKNKLHFDQMGILELETSSVMLGFTDTGDYEKIIADKLNINAEQAAQIVKDINDMLFVKIRNSLKVSPSTPEKSVVMPSSVASTPQPTLTSAAQAPLATDMQINAPVAKPEITAPLHEADVMLSEPTISIPKKVDAPAPTPVAPTVPNVTAKVEPPKPAPIYKADPYREPIE